MKSISYQRIATALLNNVRREYPHSHSGVFTSDKIFSVRAMHPIFYGCFDWHSSVHSHWSLLRVLELSDDHDLSESIISYFDSVFTVEKVAGECVYFQVSNNSGFERPYGWAWLLKLVAQLHLSSHSYARDWAGQLTPLADLLVDRLCKYLPKLRYPIRSGQHNNTAFALKLILDYAQAMNNKGLESLVCHKANEFYGADVASPYQEPGGEDFLSPSLQTALLMQQVLPNEHFPFWLSRYLPFGSHLSHSPLTAVVQSSDRTDGRLAHLDGLNLSRAWCMRSIALSFPEVSVISRRLNCLADQHLSAGSKHIHDDYMGEHWLGTFYLLALHP